MKTIFYDLRSIPQSDRSVFSDMLSYISEDILNIEKKEDSVFIAINEDKETEVYSRIEQLKEYLALDEVRNRHEATTRVLEDFSANKPMSESNAFEALVKSGSIVETATGAFSYTGIFLDVLRYFSRKIDAFGKRCFEGIQEYEEAVLCSIDEYEKGHYFESFPHHIMFQTTMQNNIELLETFSKKGTSDSGIFSNENMRRPVNVVRHAACVPVYPLLKDAQISKDKPRYFLVSGKCFRNEGANTCELSRLNEFFMKEFVCVGTLEQTMQMIAKARELWHEWIEKFDLNCTIETANDSFFASNYKKLKLFQLIGDSKQEFRVLVPSSGTYCAVSSSNVHRTHFTKPYNIKNEEAYCHSACFAFGLERLAYTLLAQKGVDSELWDEQTRTEIFGKA